MTAIKRAVGRAPGGGGAAVTPEAPREPASLAAALAPLMAAVFVVFLVTGVALPALPLHVHDRLGLGAFAVGLVGGSQFAASLVSRIWAGSWSDRRGAKRAVIVGLVVATSAGLVYLASLAFLGSPKMSAAILIFGRGLLGAGESFVIVGAQSWGLALAGPGRRARSWPGSVWPCTQPSPPARRSAPRCSQATASRRLRSQRCSSRSRRSRRSRRWRRSRRSLTPAEFGKSPERSSRRGSASPSQASASAA